MPSEAPVADAYPAAVEVADAVSVKIVVAGGRGAGKTTFLEAISDIDPVTAEAVLAEPDAAPDAAPGGEVIGFDVGRVGVDDDVVLCLFCTPDRENREFFRAELADGAAGAVVLVDLRRVDRCYPAIDLLEEHGVPLAVAVNDFGGADRFGLDEVRDALGVDAGVPVVRCDARDRDSVKQVLIALVDAAFNDR
ncbi:ATP-binding protein [Thermopolyspora sp. NPDC052614]|uniref:GTP-binding protein n=1 Tax=Thermopolyspora sp. NPDC052614 TaxID=3155682 RepID=UPI003419DB02